MERCEKAKEKTVKILHSKCWQGFLDYEESKAFNADTMSGGRLIKSIFFKRIFLSSYL